MNDGDKSRLILERYGSDLQGKSYSEIARELGVSRPLVHHVLYPIHGPSHGTSLNLKYREKPSQPTSLTAEHVDALNLVAKLFHLEPGDLVEIERHREGEWSFRIEKAEERKEAAKP